METSRKCQCDNQSHQDRDLQHPKKEKIGSREAALFVFLSLLYDGDTEPYPMVILANINGYKVK
ncbi:uncharacterized protein G2W53_039864 [Senna tora]|uniref:Uncharacterized protein n=1 Tax=Senna tora TaxID=362788 RepID=A0A834SR97_9FABA|nr:uncharacterized protein G2W53_039864 [Senna tora]